MAANRDACRTLIDASPAHTETFIIAVSGAPRRSTDDADRIALIDSGQSNRRIVEGYWRVFWRVGLEGQVAQG